MISNASAYPIAFCTPLCPCSVSTICPCTASFSYLLQPHPRPGVFSALGLVSCSQTYIVLYHTSPHFLTLFIETFSPFCSQMCPLLLYRLSYHIHPSYSSCSLGTANIMANKDRPSPNLSSSFPPQLRC